MEMTVYMLYLFAAFFLSIMNLTSIKILLPEIMTDLGVSLNWLTWVVNAYTLPLAALIPIAGRIGDIYGPRRFFLAGIFALGLGSLLCGSAFSMAWLIAGRVVQALGAALLVPNSLAILLAKVDDGKRGRVLGTWGSIGATGAVIGPVVSGSLSDFISWRGAFLVFALLSLVITAVAARQMKAGQEKASRRIPSKNSFDALGAVVLMTATASLLLGLTMLPDWGWQNSWIRASGALFLVLAYFFYRIEKRAEDPLLNPRLLTEPRFNLGLLAGFLEQFVVAGTLLVMPIFFTGVLGFGAAATALLLTPAAVTVAFFSPVGGRLADRFGPGPPIAAGMLLRSLSFIMLSQITLQSAYPFIAAGLALNGLGFAMTSSPALQSVLSTVNRAEHGISTGVHNMVRFTGAAAGTTLGGIVLYALMPATFAGLTGPVPGFREVYLVGALACLPGVAAGIYLAFLRGREAGKVKLQQCR